MKTLEVLKATNEDFEWYPTTSEILAVIKDRVPVKECHSVLEIGAGDGRVLAELFEGHEYQPDKYAVEKSLELLKRLPADVFIVGTEFRDVTLIDKKVDVIFCNPPYSAYEFWAAKIISEANAKVVYLVLPERWNTKFSITEAIEKRKARVNSLGFFDFLNAERRARARVEVLELRFESIAYHTHELEVDPFGLWFEKTFKFEADKTSKTYESKEQFTAKVQDEVVTGNLVEVLVQFYNEEMQKLYNNFVAISSLDRELLEELGVSVSGLKGSLQLRLKNLKSKYWKEVFSNLASVTKRLTKNSRTAMLDKLFNHTSIDFTKANVYALVIWVIKNANCYYDSQLAEVVEQMVSKANVKLYKSNKTVWEDDNWYYNRTEQKNYGLELRIVMHRVGGLEVFYGEVRNELSTRARDFIMDLLTVANNLGYVTDAVPEKVWYSGEKHEFKQVDETLLMAVKAFKNGNLHIKFNQQFIRDLNVEFGRIRGWLKTAKQASEELNIPLKKVNYKKNYQLTGSSVMLLKG